MAAARHAGITARVHLKVDTGLERAGAYAADFTALLDAAVAAAREGTVRVVGVWSHLACADEPGHPSIRAQQLVFEAAVAEAARTRLRARGPTPSQFGCDSDRSEHYDLVRTGIAIYGLSPVPRSVTPRHTG